VTAAVPEQRILELLDSWETCYVSVRITAGSPAQLVAVFSGRLQRRSDEKHPALFWPLKQAYLPEAERPGIYVHSDTFDGGLIHPGNFVVELRHGAVATNVRLLDARAVFDWEQPLTPDGLTFGADPGPGDSEGGGTDSPAK
jgi:hypothetical protein